MGTNIVEEFGLSNIKKFLDDLHEDKLLPSGGEDVDTNNLLTLAADVQGSDRMLRSLKNLEPMLPKEDLTQFEQEEISRILITVMALPITEMPIIRSNFTLVQRIAKWRLQINR